MKPIRYMTVLVCAGVLLAWNAFADDKIKSAMSAGPSSISKEATVMDWNDTILRKGSNDWTCLPDRPTTEGNDPWCIDKQWLNFLNAYKKKEKPTYTGVGIAYMLQGDAPVSNTDPYATEPTGKENDWVTGVGAHLMIIVPDHEAFKGISTDHRNGGPWIMWPDTPYAHIMVPVTSR